MAAYIKKEFDSKHGPTWHCIVGRNFGAPARCLLLLRAASCWADPTCLGSTQQHTLRRTNCHNAAAVRKRAPRLAGFPARVRRSPSHLIRPPCCPPAAGSYVTHETKHFIYFYLGPVAVLLFKSG